MSNTISSSLRAPLGPPSAGSGISLPEPPAELDLAGRIGYYHALAREAAQVSIMAAVAAGVELHRAKATAEHGMFQHWIKTNCEFGLTTASKYMALAEKLLGAGLPPLLAASEAPTLDAVAAEVPATPIEAKTLTQLYFDFGICRPGKVGGRREGAGRPPKDAQSLEAALDAVATDPKLAADECHGWLGRLYDWAITRDGWGCLSDADLVTARATLKDILQRAEQIAASRTAIQPKRSR